jgi:hypothetical protein
MSVQYQRNTPKKSPISRLSAFTRYFYIGMALSLMFIVFVGFGPSYFGSILQGGCNDHEIARNDYSMGDSYARNHIYGIRLSHNKKNT